MTYGIHIGLNKVDPAAYSGWSGTLHGAVNDAHDMFKIINPYTVAMLTDEKATTSALIDKAVMFSKLVEKDDIVYITYSGHGGQVPDTNNDEADRLNETWCLYDGQISDDYIKKIIDLFNCTVIVVSDSCHSGTISKSVFGFTAEIRIKELPAEIKASQTAVIHRPHIQGPFYKPNVLTLSGCQDFEVSWDDGDNGAFTKAIKKKLKPGIEYIDLLVAIRGELSGKQTPKLTYRNGSKIIHKKAFSNI